MGDHKRQSWYHDTTYPSKNQFRRSPAVKAKVRSHRIVSFLSGSRWVICHIIIAAQETRFFFSPQPRRCSKAKPGALRGSKTGHSWLHQQRRHSRVIKPKCGCLSGSLLPTYGYSIPALLHGPTRAKFSSAGCSLIQVGGESAPPWTWDGKASTTRSPTNRCVHREALLLPVNSSD